MKKLIFSLILVLFLAVPVLAENIYTLTWVNATGTATEATTCFYTRGFSGGNNPCVSDGTQRVAINTTTAYNISYHCDSITDTNHTATDWDINFHLAPTATSAYSGITVNSERYFGVDSNIADVVFAGELTPPRIKWMKLTLDENGALRADVTCTIIIYGKHE